MPRRDDAESDADGEADGCDDGKHRRVDRVGDVVRTPGTLRHPIEEPDSTHHQRETQHAADDGDRHALDEQLPDDPPAVRAQRDPNADLARSANRTRQQQIRHVHARDQQDQQRRAQ
jgi:hypothetical protein